MFCRYCGTEKPAQTGFCSGCRAITGALTADPQPIPNHSRPSARKPFKNKLMDLLMITVAIILLFLGIGHMALAVVGIPATAHVTDYEQMLYVNNDDSTRNPSRYKLEYQFSVNGERYSGSVTRVFSSGSHMRQTIPVRYLPFWPHINTEERDVNPVGPVTLGAGVLMLMFGVRKKLRNS